MALEAGLLDRTRPRAFLCGKTPRPPSTATRRGGPDEPDAGAIAGLCARGFAGGSQSRGPGAAVGPVLRVGVAVRRGCRHDDLQLRLVRLHQQLPGAQASAGPAVLQRRTRAGAPGSVPRRPACRSQRRDVRRLVSYPAASGLQHASGPHADRAKPVSVSRTQRARLLRPGRAAVSAAPPSHPTAHLHGQRDRPVAGRRAHAGPHLQFATRSREHAPRDRAAGHHRAATRRADAA